MTEKIWKRLQARHAAVKDRPILTLFEEDAARFDTFSARAGDMLLDWSKTNIDAPTRDLLVELMTAAGVAGQRDAMFRGDRINDTEGRAVLHTALRDPDGPPLMMDGADARAAIRETLARMERFAHGVRAGGVSAADGRPFSDVVNIGIGGSDLGPAMATLALAPCHDGPRLHFVSNVDGAHVADTLKGLDPRRTLVIVASKTFTTIETMTNAETALGWLRAALGADAASHLAAVSTALARTTAMGVAEDRVFGFADWVGGRYSLWGPVGLPIMLAVGPEGFRDLLAGGRAMDRHFIEAPFGENLPALMALTGLWHRNVCGYPTRAVLPYDQRLSRLPAYLQQLDMESNGKRVAKSGAALERPSGPVVWGEPGTNGQHAFFQLLHQGTDVIPAEFLIAAEGHEPELAHQHDLLIANCLAQSEALMRGRGETEAREIAARLGFDGAELVRQAAHRVFPGARPSITLAYPKLTPFTLGQIIALFEHRVFVEGAVWGVNSFDQWGVELGKELATQLLPMVRGGDAAGKDGSTAGLLDYLSGKS